jgi:hypothetical protein
MKKNQLKLVLAAVGAAGSLLSAQANVVTGSIWENDSDPATPANVPLTAPNVTFTANSPLNFSSYSGGGTSGADNTFYTIASWLNTGGGVITSGAANGGDTMDNTLFNFTGTVSVTSGEQFTITHDDGVTLVIGGDTVVSAPGATAPVQTTDTYTGPTGNESFQLVYSEVDGPGAVLQVDLPFVGSPVPEPSTFVAGALLLLPLGLQSIRSWKNRKQAA